MPAGPELWDLARNPCWAVLPSPTLEFSAPSVELFRAREMVRGLALLEPNGECLQVVSNGIWVFKLPFSGVLQCCTPTGTDWGCHALLSGTRGSLESSAKFWDSPRACSKEPTAVCGDPRGVSGATSFHLHWDPGYAHQRSK